VEDGSQRAFYCRSRSDVAFMDALAVALLFGALVAAMGKPHRVDCSVEAIEPVLDHRRHRTDADALLFDEFTKAITVDEVHGGSRCRCGFAGGRRESSERH
jgi:hypothetical protein